MLGMVIPTRKKRIKNADNDAYYNIQASLITSLASRIDESRWPAFLFYWKLIEYGIEIFMIFHNDSLILKL